MHTDPRSLSGALVPAKEPPKTKLERRGNLVVPVANSGAGDYATGTGPMREGSGPVLYAVRGEGDGASKVELDATCALWAARYQRWRTEFDREMVPRIEEYWKLWRNDDTFPPYAVGSEWRDRATVPSPFKWIETRLPRKMMALFGGREWFSVEGVEERDEFYESTVHETMLTCFDQIGQDEPDGRTFMERMVDAERYCEIVGHVWYKEWWRVSNKTLKVRVKDDNGKWQWATVNVEAYNNLDLDWLPITALAVDLNPTFRRWSIERVCTTLENLVAEDAAYEAVTGEKLYPRLPELLANPGTPTIESDEEPALTEGWPLENPSGMWADVGETPVEMWYCWDNQKYTLTKIANRSIVLDEGLAPTPDGLDPYVAGRAVPIVNQVYGDSILNWVGPLANRVTKLGRMRMDETALGVFGQFAHRENMIIGSNEQFLTPGGHITIKSHGDPNRPLKADFDMIHRAPILQDAVREAAYSQQEGEAAAAADPVSQGVEATQKSRDVTKAEIDARMVQGSGRYQLENLYFETGRKKRLLYKAWGLIQTNLTTPRSIMVNGQPVVVDLSMLQRAVNIRIGGGLHEVSRDAQLQEIAMWGNLAEKAVFQPYIDPIPILQDLASMQRRQSSRRYIKAPPQVAQEGQEAQLGKILEQVAGAGPAAPAGGTGSPAGVPGPAAAGSIPAPAPPGAADLGMAPAGGGAGVDGGFEEF